MVGFDTYQIEIRRSLWRYSSYLRVKTIWTRFLPRQDSFMMNLKSQGIMQHELKWKSKAKKWRNREGRYIEKINKTSSKDVLQESEGKVNWKYSRYTCVFPSDASIAKIIVARKKKGGNFPLVFSFYIHFPFFLFFFTSFAKANNVVFLIGAHFPAIRFSLRDVV